MVIPGGFPKICSTGIRSANNSLDHIRVSQGAKSMKNYTSSPDSCSLCQVHYKNAKNPNFEAVLGVLHPLPNFA